MTDTRRACVVAAIATRYPATTIISEPNPDPGTAADIPEAIVILGVPDAERSEVHDFALDVAFAAYGDDPIPFLFFLGSPEDAERHHSRAAAASGQVSES